MADPQVLYVVSTVVVLALVAWVIVVNATAPPAVDVTKAPPSPPPEPPAETKAEAKAEAKTDTKAEAKPAPEAKPEPMPEPEAKAEPKPEPKAEPEAKADDDFPPERPSRAGLRNYDEIQDEPSEPKGGDGSGES